MTMYSKLEDPARQEAVDLLLAVGIDSGIDEFKARALLEKHNWDANAAAGELLSDQPPPLEFHPPSPAGNPYATKWSPGVQNVMVSEYGHAESVNVSVPKGALNSRTVAPLQVVPYRKSDLPKEFIDLTGEDEESQLQKAMAASLEGTNHESEVAAGPKNVGETASVRPTGDKGITLSQEEQALNRALEDSIATSLSTDVYREFPPVELTRKPGYPVTPRTKKAGQVHITLLLRALLSVPQIKVAFSRWRRDSASDAGDGPMGPQLILQDRKKAVDAVFVLQKVFALLTCSEKSSENIDDALQQLPLPPLHPNSPGDDMKELYDLHLALLCETVFRQSGLLTVRETTGQHKRLFLTRTGTEEKDFWVPSGIAIESRDLSTLEVITTSSESEPNTLEVAMFNHMLKHSIKSFIINRAPVLAIRVTRHALSPRTPLIFPKKLFLDPFLWESRDLVLAKVSQMEDAQDNIEKINKLTQQFMPHDDKNPIADLKQTIYYLENVADRTGAGRAEHLDGMAAKLKLALSKIEGELTNCANQVAELHHIASSLFSIPELQRHPYELRAILVHDGLVGRAHSYAYIANGSQDWYMCCDASVLPVTEEQVMNDASGLQLNAGPYFFVYSDAMREDDSTILTWPEELARGLADHNETFHNELKEGEVPYVGEVIHLDATMTDAEALSPDPTETRSGQASRGSSTAPSPLSTPSATGSVTPAMETPV